MRQHFLRRYIGILCQVLDFRAGVRCSFVIERYEYIKDVICVIFKNFPLHTSKKLDFEDFYQAVLVKDKKNLSNAELDRILSLKNGMNSKREKFTYFTTDSQIIINPNGFIGF